MEGSGHMPGKSSRVTAQPHSLVIDSRSVSPINHESPEGGLCRTRLLSLPEPGSGLAHSRSPSNGNQRGPATLPTGLGPAGLLAGMEIILCVKLSEVELSQ